MKLTKKLTVLFNTALTILSSVSVFASDNATLTSSVSGDKTKGAEITVSIKVEDVVNLGGAEIELSYDSDDLEYVSGEVSEDFTSSATDIVDDGNVVKVSLMYGEPVDGSGTVSTLKFKVLADERQKVNLGLSAVLVDIDTYEEISVAVSGTSFVVDTTEVEDDFLYGDANSDKRVNVLDAVLMKKKIAGFDNLTIDLKASDVNVDTRINVMDAVMVLKYIAGYDIELGKSK